MSFPNISKGGSSGGGGQVATVVAGSNITVDNTDPAAPVINNNAPNVQADWTASGTAAEILNKPATLIQSIQAGANITVDNSDPVNPIIAAAAGGGGQAMRLLLGADFTVSQDGFTKMPFDQIPFNDGFTYNADLEVETPQAGTVLITASIGAVVPVGMAQDLTVGCLLFKNGVPLRQSSKTKLVAPYCIAEITVIDKCVLEDKYVLYVTAIGGDEEDITISSEVSALEIAYL